MQVANIAFLLDRLAADTPPNQQIRELTENALEAIERRQKAGDTTEGVIRWDVDWDNLKRTNQFKLSIVDNGDGMTSQQMLDYLNALAVQGANQTQATVSCSTARKPPKGILIPRTCTALSAGPMRAPLIASQVRGFASLASRLHVAQCRNCSPLVSMGYKERR